MAHCITGVPFRARVRFPTAPAEFSTRRSVIWSDSPFGTLNTTVVPLPEACWARLIVPPAPTDVDPAPAAPPPVPEPPDEVPLPVCPLPPVEAPVLPPLLAPAAVETGVMPLAV